MPGRGKLQYRVVVVLTAAIAVAATAAVVFVPGARFAFRSPNLHVALLTAETLIGLLAAYLAFERFVRRRRLDSLVLCLALELLALPNLVFAAVPVVVADDTTVFATWSALIGRFAGSVALVTAAFVGTARIRRLSPRALAGVVVAIPLLVLGAIAFGVGAFEHSLPRAVPSGIGPELSGTVRIDGHWAIQAFHLVGLAAFATAAAGFTRRAERTGDEVLRWLPIAANAGHLPGLAAVADRDRRGPSRRAPSTSRRRSPSPAPLELRKRRPVAAAGEEPACGSSGRARTGAKPSGILSRLPQASPRRRVRAGGGCNGNHHTEAP